MGIIVAAVLVLGFMWESIVISIAVSLLSALATCELIHNAAGVKDIQSVLGACVFAFIITMQNYNRRSKKWQITKKQIKREKENGTSKPLKR